MCVLRAVRHAVSARAYRVRVRHPALGTLVFFVAAPGTTAALVPWLITGWEGSPAGWDAVDLLSVLAGLAGLAIVAACLVRFVRGGRGPACRWAPPAPCAASVRAGARPRRPRRRGS